ncbi:hypothetical protein [Mesorhizobium sp. WSM4906]|uniref:hypothetical protein n=1 Tax=Mesorhizobium sp. WSM4906 TaxID=3038546 RepID=UPI002417AE0A|nr:hypothetical protein [Mesorhizobium sp. WSM4906]WFP74867.1 hypothetical protein QAZ22_24505 [Mesorhizobium sp. WSM4906]
MTKTLDSLQTLSRVLLLLAATLIVTAAYYNRPFSYTRVQEGLTGLGRAYDGLLGDIKADATQVYRAQLSPAFSAAPAGQAKIIEAIQFTPALLTAGSDAGKAIVNLATADPTVQDMFTLTNFNWQAISYTVSTLDAGQFMKFVDEAVNMVSWNGLITAKDLVVEVGEMNLQTGTCVLRLRSETWEQQKRSPLAASIGCSAAAPRDVTTLWQNFYFSIQNQLDLLRGVPISANIFDLPRTIAISKLATLAATETPEEEKEDLLGVKIGIVGMLNIGPIVIIAILAMMLGQVRWTSRLPDKDPAESTFWYSQFLGLTSVSFVIALWALPIVAVGMAMSATYVEPPGLFGKPWYDPDLLQAQKWFIIALLGSLGLSTWLAVENGVAARKWRERLKAAAPKPDDAAASKARWLGWSLPARTLPRRGHEVTEEALPAKAPRSRSRRSQSAT